MTYGELDLFCSAQWTNLTITLQNCANHFGAPPRLPRASLMYWDITQVTWSRGDGWEAVPDSIFHRGPSSARSDPRCPTADPRAPAQSVRCGGAWNLPEASWARGEKWSQGRPPGRRHGSR